MSDPQKLSQKAADILMGTPTPILELGELASVARRTADILDVDLGALSRAQLLIEVDATMRALDTYPTTPDFPADIELVLPLPAWESL